MAKVSFRTNAELKSIIGKDLITDDNIAVLELVKNSFDAGSKKVDIIFENLIHNSDSKSYKRNNNSRIIISDLGKGMSQFDIENKWLNIAYSEKKEKKEEYGRTLAGNKGVGRFSCDRLGKYLTIYTKQENDSYYIQLSINWVEFEKKDNINLNIQDIEIDLIEINEIDFQNNTNIEPFSSGTALVIQSLREEWNYDKILSLKRQLERLINPNQSFNSIKFDINIITNEYASEQIKRPAYEKINGLVKNQIFEKLNFKVTSIQSKITNDGEHIITILKDRGNTIFTLIEKNRFNLLKDIKTHIYYLNPYSKAYFTKQTGIRSVDFGSISLFINGFRIPPYGDYGDDWLGMENRKGQGRSRYLGTREVIGRIEVKNNDDISDEDEDEDDVFKIISSRSGIVNNDIFTQLAKSSSPFGFYYKTFRRLERFVVEGINWDSIVEKNTNKIEQEILNNPKWDESKEVFAEDSLTRNKRVFNVVQNIIDAKKDELIKLSINQNFVLDLIDEQKIKVSNELESIINQLNNKKLNPEELQELLVKLNSSHKELNDFEIKIGRTDDEIKDIKIELENSLKVIKAQKDELELKLKESEEIRKSAEAENKRIAEELELEVEKNTYLRTSSRNLSEDAKGLVHNIKITSKKISDSVDNLYDKILIGKIENKQILSSLASIKFQSEKALKISNIITRSNFNSDKNAQIVDVVKYINQYIDIYSHIYPKTELQFEVLDNQSKLIKKISVLDISVIIDDLISNSEKANAKKIQIIMKNISNESIEIIFSDDGDGVPAKFLDNKNKIFELGVTTTLGGSGIGLNSVKTALKAMKGEITFIGNNLALAGACFKITL